MFFEYAIEPKAVSDLGDLQDLYRETGIYQGRLVSDYPDQRSGFCWSKRVLNSSDRTWRERQLVTELLAKMEHKNILIPRPELPWNMENDDDWVLNARNVLGQQSDAFDAILTASTEEPEKKIVRYKSMDNDHPLWRWPPRCECTSEAMVAVARYLFRYSTEIIFVDPHFDLFYNKKPKEKYIEPLSAFLNAIFCGDRGFKKVKRLEYHFSGSEYKDNGWKDKVIDVTAWKELCEKKFAPLIPQGQRLELKCWLPDYSRKSREFMHTRLIFTELAGFRFDHGLDLNPTSQSVDILREEQLKSHWEEYVTTPWYKPHKESPITVDGTAHERSPGIDRPCSPLQGNR